ncbi:MAG: nitrate reductase [Desulfatitalea sp.]|nr:nitrate reductase [Desulfatitalea sp.]
MHAFYQLVAGPLTWAAFVIFLAGLTFRLVQMVLLARKSEPFIFSYMSLKYSLRSIAHWIVPFATLRWRTSPVMTIVTFAFHICLVATPLFLLSHIVLWDEAWRIKWWALPDSVADVMTVIVIAGCLFFAIRRVIRPEVRFLTDGSDYLLLALTAAPFVTGLMAYHQWTQGPWMTIAHMLSGQLLLVAIPFTRLRHMLLGWLTRAYMGSEFGGVRRARDY